MQEIKRCEYIRLAAKKVLGMESQNSVILKTFRNRIPKLSFGLHVQASRIAIELGNLFRLKQQEDLVSVILNLLIIHIRYPS